MEYGEIKTNLYDKVEYHFNVDIEILTNSITGEQEIGWTPHGSRISKLWETEFEDDGEESYE